MIDHVLGRPSSQFRKYQVFCVTLFWTIFLLRGPAHGPPVPTIRRLSKVLSRRLTAFQTFLLTMLFLYVSRNFGKLMNLECPEPLGGLYSRSYFRATWFLTSLDAGFWTAMRIRRKWLRDVSSIVFSIFYMFAAEMGDEKVRKVRATITVAHMRTSWEKSTSPYLALLNKILHPTANSLAFSFPRKIRIPRPVESAEKEPIEAWVYFNGPVSQLKKCSKILLDFPGGGFVSMTPRNYEDKLVAWAKYLNDSSNPGTTGGVVVVSLEYKKAPEYPYPYALNECYDAYHSVVYSKGKVVGLNGKTTPTVVFAGDSAGGNFATGVALMILDSTSQFGAGRHRGDVVGLPLPAGLVLIYPSLDLSIGSWMTNEQLSLIRDRQLRKTNRSIIRRKSEQFKTIAGLSTMNISDSEDQGLEMLPKNGSVKRSHDDSNGNGSVLDAAHRTVSDPIKSGHIAVADAAELKDYPAMTKPRLATRLAMTSRLSYFNDRILTPEMMRAMVILYIGPDNQPDFSTDYLLSPICAPESHLAKFPKTYFLTGERDPLVDDTVIFAGRIRAAKLAVYRHRREMGINVDTRPFREHHYVEVSLLPGVSHGFLQMGAVFPQARREIIKCAKWIGALFESADRGDKPSDVDTDYDMYYSAESTGGEQTPPMALSRARTSSISESDKPLEMARLLPTTNASLADSGSHGGTKTKGNTKVPRRKSSTGSKHGRPNEKLNRNISTASLNSEEDLMSRRMGNLVAGLTGNAEMEQIMNGDL